MRFNISGEVNIVEPPIMRYIDAEIQKDRIRHYAAKTTPDRLVVVEPGAVLMRITDEEIPVTLFTKTPSQLMTMVSLSVNWAYV